MIRKFRDLVKDSGKDVAIVVGRRIIVICEVLCRCQDSCYTLKTHSGIDMVFLQWSEGTVRLSIVLDEDQIPDLNTPGRIFVY